MMRLNETINDKVESSYLKEVLKYYCCWPLYNKPTQEDHLEGIQDLLDELEEMLKPDCMIYLLRANYVEKLQAASNSIMRNSAIAFNTLLSELERPKIIKKENYF